MEDQSNQKTDSSIIQARDHKTFLSLDDFKAI
jgi:hypothetical protein